MANEATVTCGMRIDKGNLHYQSALQSFQPTVTGSNGPTPGAFQAAIGAGTIVDFSHLTAYGGLYQIINLDPTNFITVGIWNGSSFFPLQELLPGEAYNGRISRHFGIEYGSGTGTVTGTYSLKVVADTSACQVAVLAFDP